MELPYGLLYDELQFPPRTARMQRSGNLLHFVFNRVQIAVLLGALAAFGQTPDYRKLLADADRLAWLTNWYDALPLYERSESLATAAGDQRSAAYARIGALRGRMQVQSLPALAEKLDEELESDLSKNDPALRLRVLVVKGDVEFEYDVAAARRTWQQALELAKQADEKGWENRVSGDLGMVAFLEGDTARAKQLVAGALKTAMQSGDIGGQLRYLGMIASGLYLAGDSQQALSYFDKGFQLAAAHPDTGFPYVLYWGKIKTLMALRRYDEAERLTEAALQEARSGDRRVKEAQMLIVSGQIAAERNQPTKAIEYLKQAAALSAAGDFRRLSMHAKFELATLFRESGKLQEAEAHAREAAEAIADVGDRYLMPPQLQNLAELAEAQGRWLEADRLYQRGTDVLEGVMANVPSAAARARLIGVQSRIYANHFRLAAERLRDAEKAYLVLERARGRALADVLQTDPSTKGQELVTSEMAAFARSLGRLQAQLLREKDPRERRRILSQLLELDRKRYLAEATNSRLSAPVLSEPVALKSIREGLQPDEALLIYVLGEPRSHCLVITRESATLAPLAGQREIDRSVETYTRSLKTRQEDQAAARRLYRLVLGSVPGWSGKRVLVTVPDGKLHLLPFDTLVRPGGRRLLDSFTVVSSPSATVHHLLRQARRVPVRRRPLLAVGGVPYSQQTSATTSAVLARAASRGLYDVRSAPDLNPLPSSKPEVLAAARIAGRSSVVLLGDEATESAFKKQAHDQFEVVHLAVHGFADPKNPERAALVLLGNPSTGEDGLLQPQEISRMRLGTNVVVLSACETAVGSVLGQEGVANLARAFVLAGAQSVITTLWPVDDTVSMALMTRFYRNLAAGSTVAGALQGAKRSMLARFGLAALPTVAGFQVFGSGHMRVRFGRGTSGPTLATRTKPSATVSQAERQ